MRLLLDEVEGRGFGTWQDVQDKVFVSLTLSEESRVFGTTDADAQLTVEAVLYMLPAEVGMVIVLAEVTEPDVLELGAIDVDQ